MLNLPSQPRNALFIRLDQSQLLAAVINLCMNKQYPNSISIQCLSQVNKLMINQSHFHPCCSTVPCSRRHIARSPHHHGPSGSFICLPIPQFFLSILFEPLLALDSTVVTFQKQRGMSQSDCPLRGQFLLHISSTLTLSLLTCVHQSDSRSSQPSSGCSPQCLLGPPPNLAVVVTRAYDRLSCPLMLPRPLGHSLRLSLSSLGAQFAHIHPFIKA
jgi:hypothetical protein